MNYTIHKPPDGYIYERKDGSFQTYLVALPEGEDINKNYKMVKNQEEK